MNAWMSKQWASVSYRFFGPTTIHLQHEFYLIVALSLLEVSSLQALYKDSFGLIGDFQLTALATIWLSRFLALRWFMTWDTSTSLRPSLRGVWTHWIASYVVAGQYFDRPSPEVVGKQLGTHHVDDGRTGIALKHLFVPSLHFTWHYIKVCIWYPLLTIQECVIRVPNPLKRTERLGATASSTNGSNAMRTASSFNPISLTSLNKFWKLYVPPLQMIIPIATVVFIIWYEFFEESVEETPHALTMHTYASSGVSELDVKAYGAYKKMEKPKWTEVLYFLSCGGTIIGILLYGRILLPIPDLVAGMNVLKALRTESKSYVGGSTYTIGKSPRVSKVQRENPELPWLEHYKSIVGENRWRLFCKVGSVRIIENIFVCVLFPRTAFACRATGHCSNSASFLGLSKIFFHVGITSPLRSDNTYQSQFAMIPPDRGSAMMTLISVAVITFSLLLAQAATLNRSYLGIMGYLAGEWVVVNTETDPSFLDGSARPLQWDPRRKYKRGDLIYENASPSFGKAVYRATSNNPEGRPSDLYLRATHYLFRNEQGHPAASHIIAFLSTLQFGLVSVLIFVILAYQLLDYNNTSLLWTLAANLVAVYGTIGVAVPNYSEFDNLAHELNGTK